MKHFYKTLLIVTLFPLFSLAQGNYKPGYVVNLTGDTLHGFIDYREWENNPRSILFKNTINQTKPENFSVHTSNAFAIINAEYYQKFAVRLSTDKTDINNLPLAIDTTFIMDTVFLRLDTRGKYFSLFTYTDNIKSRFFALETGHNTPVELSYHVYYNAAESSSLQRLNTYRDQLRYFSQKAGADSGKIAQQILITNYSESELVKITQLINGSFNQQFTPQKRNGNRWLLGAAINYSTLKLLIRAGSSFGSDKNTNSSSVLPKIDAGIDLFVNKATQRLLVRLELGLTANKYDISVSDMNSVPQANSKLNFTQYIPSFTPQIIYNFYNKESLNVFIGVGASLTFAIYNQYQYVTTYQGNFAESSQKNYPPFNKFWVAIPVKAGVAINKRIEINVSYSPSVSVLNDSSFGGNIVAYQAGFNYLFGGK